MFNNGKDAVAQGVKGAVIKARPQSQYPGVSPYQGAGSLHKHPAALPQTRIVLWEWYFQQ